MNLWIRCFKPNPSAKLRLFCFPYAGGNAAIFRTWVLPEVEVYAIQLPGRSDRLSEPPFTQLMPLVNALAPILVPYCDRPYAFFGHSMGALLAFELARRYSPQHLWVSGRRAPQVDNSQVLHTLSDAAFLAELRAMNGTPSQVLENAELMQIFLPILRADFSVCETYRYEEKMLLDCPISAFGGVDDATEPPLLLEGWRSQTRGDFSLHLLSGDHFFLQTQQQALLAQLADRLGF
jgi:medium-chain acyl-[acyl-carrier-protein] hydrolase